VLSFLALIIHRRLLWFTVPSQAFQVLPLFIACHAIELLTRMMVGDAFPGFWLLLAPAVESLLWPVASILLLIPQKRTPNPDAHRPL
jgi:rod shape-determining protein MreD